MGKHARHKHAARSWRRWDRLVVIGGAALLLGAVGVGVAVFAGRSDDPAPVPASATSTSAVPAAQPVVDVYKSATCGCCTKWMDHLREAGFTVRATNTEDLATFKSSHGVPRAVHSCHTAIVDGYVIEGHVPAPDVRRLLAERPAVAGLGVGGMPIGSPGMEAAGAAQPYDVMAFDKDGVTRVFATHR